MIRFEHVNQSFDGHPVLQDLSFTIETGERVVLYGPSGAGKSTILRLLAGLLQPDFGRITGLEGPVSIVFQKDRLFDGMSALENIEYGTRWKASRKEQIRTQAEAWGTRFGCKEFLQQKAATLSGGQRQRAAIARAFMKNPSLVLLDESLNSLDAVLKEELIHTLLEVQADRKMTMVFVTHDFEEARKLGQRILLLRDGRLAASGSAAELYRNPVNLFEAAGFGPLAMNILPGSLFNRKGFAGIRPGSCALHEEKGWISLPAQYVSSTDMGFAWLHTFLIEQSQFQVLNSRQQVLSQTVWLDPDALLYFDEQGRRIEDEVPAELTN